LRLALSWGRRLRQLLAVNSGGSPESTAPKGGFVCAEAIRVGLRLRSMTPPLHLTGQLEKAPGGSNQQRKPGRRNLA
jgi:hypothetical protein